MKLKLFLIAAGLVSQAQAIDFPALGTKDLIPLSVRYRRVVVNDITGAQGLRVTVYVKNIGSLPVQGLNGGVMVAAIWNTHAALYGPSGGGYNLGAPIRTGQTGMFLFDAPLDSLRRCLRSKIWIDTRRTLQKGPVSVIYLNDSKVLPAVDEQSPAICPGEGALKP
jgi:hypothetical protein